MSSPLTPPATIPFLAHLGLTASPSEPGSSCVHLPELKPEHCNLLPAAHGGVVMTLLDVAMARAARSHPKAATDSVVTVEMSTRFIRPARGPLTARGRVVHGGGSLCTCEAQVLDEQGTLLATAQGTFKYWKAAGPAVE
ncbi:MAG: PaaI family thioesterase [Rubrivivax sp.]|nr:PaaI family thioesterase [Rubrivivax sp.]